MRIKRDEDGLILSLNRDFYSKEVIDLAARDFGKVCRISSSDRGGYHVVRFSGLETGDLKGIALEFANYVLFVLKTKGDSYKGGDTKRVLLIGSVIDGSRKTSHIARESKMLEEKIGFKPYPGTLNVKLISASNIERLNSSEAILIKMGNEMHVFYKCRINGNDVVVKKPIRYGKDLETEIIAPFSLRKRMSLKNGDLIELVIS